MEPQEATEIVEAIRRCNRATVAVTNSQRGVKGARERERAAYVALFRLAVGRRPTDEELEAMIRG